MMPAKHSAVQRAASAENTSRSCQGASKTKAAMAPKRGEASTPTSIPTASAATAATHPS